MPQPSHPSRLDQSNYTWRRVHTHTQWKSGHFLKCYVS
jgi:hypothetical protein